ncbi:unnamed protein product [Cuscuta campestris]|uniref:Uncharacterized protein n=1 Tax=Cuscuta campestris TaxID=132261 RepID=A0A484LQE8_9ASTE|nr:unnamed protein product [Cuscuta campestris]
MNCISTAIATSFRAVLGALISGFCVSIGHDADGFEGCWSGFAVVYRAINLFWAVSSNHSEWLINTC